MKAVLTIENLRMLFGGLVAVDQVNFTLHEGEIASIIGPNGAGKTTVFNCISGFYKPTSGKICLDGVNITGKPSHYIARLGLTRTFQNIRLFKEMTVIENLLVANFRTSNRGYFSGIFKLPSFKKSEKEALNKALYWLKCFNLENEANTTASNLSYGQQRRLEIARCMMIQPRVLILDEPAAGLNPSETKELMGFINFLRSEHNVSILLIEHDMNLIMHISENIMVMEYGKPIAYGTPEQIKNNRKVIRAYLGEA